MKLKNLLYATVGSAVLAFSTASCSDYLDISGEFNASLGVDQVWDNATYTRNWYGVIYRNLMEYSETGSEVSAFKNPWSNLCGEIASEKASSRDVMMAGFTAASGSYHRWATFYKDIRQAMIFIERAHDGGVGDPTSTNKLTAEEIARMKDECRFMIAYYYFSMFELYGPACIVTEIDDAAEPHVTNYDRATVDEMVNHIDGILAPLCDPAQSKLPESVITSYADNAYNFNTNEVVRPTIVVAKALRAKLWMYAASKLFNGGDGSEYYQGLQKLQNSKGEYIFPQSKDPQKWVTARDRVKDLIDYAEAQHHTLYRVMANGVEQPDRSIYNLFQVYNEEILWCSTNNSYSDQYKMEKRTNPRDVNSCYGTIGPSQDAVDMFFMTNGLDINDPNSGYDETGFSAVENRCYDPDYKDKKTDQNISNMYANREPRFYASVVYQGRSWFKKWMNGNPNYTVDFSAGGGNDLSNGDNVKGGYMLGKFKNRTVNHASGDTQSWKRVSIIYRLAEFYLFYAEALNEIDPSNADIIKYIDIVRERAGIPGYQTMNDNGIKTGVIGNYDKQFDAIQHERYVELYCEGQRYFDVRRWMVCGDEGRIGCDQTRFYGMNMKGAKDKAPGEPTSYYTRTKLENRQWTDKLYLYPIHQNVIELAEGRIPQNYGW
ncbi:RagB/SusD family nutrient uptake outer membrane protein [Bacteroides oleiciplenus]|uniref:RagB/SusD domain-containing protein n=1 Tax=Bacteroides oleiciplenus YIT 12058 TaxID=742727 RepID=K9E4W8_9BACE|nr:RagB/SusD family nutrient uptake outer membrane protein [Bacteroides oleiciplenus]EKU90806.1 hypothetical protein HMPREF9447_02224 [Bacteroides oleiciplenus YIT 12058]